MPEGLDVIDAARDAGDYVDLGATVDEEPLPTVERWEAAEIMVYCHLAGRRQDVDDALGALEHALQDGLRPTAAEVQAARGALDHVRELVEEHYAPLAPETTPLADGAGRTVPYHAMIQQLERAGYEVTRDGGRTYSGP